MAVGADRNVEYGKAIPMKTAKDVDARGPVAMAIVIIFVMGLVVSIIASGERDGGGLSGDVAWFVGEAGHSPTLEVRRLLRNGARDVLTGRAVFESFVRSECSSPMQLATALDIVNSSIVVPGRDGWRVWYLWGDGEVGYSDVSGEGDVSGRLIRRIVLGVCFA